MSAGTWIIILLAVVAVAIFVLYLTSTAGRLDRLHKRIDTSSLSLDAQLLRRSAATLECVSAGLFDPASRLVLTEAAHAARVADASDAVERSFAESELTQALHLALGADPSLGEIEIVVDSEDALVLLEDLLAVCTRVALSRRFHNDGVRACRMVRRHLLVRWFGLAGHTPWPETFEFDDTPPAVRLAFLAE